MTIVHDLRDNELDFYEESERGIYWTKTNRPEGYKSISYHKSLDSVREWHKNGVVNAIIHDDGEE